MDTRREFLKKAAMLGAGASVAVSLPESIARALAINPEVGSTFMDAEHIVILMQENRSFDHCYGTLQGVRGFNDPRAISLPNQNPVWFQSNERGETFAPFRLNIKDTRATWMGSLPHSWTDQVDARNHGKMDQWLVAKRSGHKDYKEMPLTMGYYNRQDIPFYYALADAFTVCDQHFCSSLTGTTPNRLYLWTGTIREKASTDAYANVRNENLDYDKLASWTTFPERLEKHGVTWKIYQNELSVGVGFEGDEDSWLANFTDNPIEWFEKYHVKFHPAYHRSLPGQIERLKATREKLETVKSAGNASETDLRKLGEITEEIQQLESDLRTYTPENFKKLSALERDLHTKAFTTNTNDPAYHKLDALSYNDGTATRTVKVPAGDVLHQFREDVKNNQLPAVSWLVAPENFSDHPGAPWYGAWYVSEVMDILTKNPEVWKKTIFILTYDENDGYFDHVPPFVPVNPHRKHGGKMSATIERDLEFVTLEQDKVRKAEPYCRESAIGLGYRVPMVVASPWSRGGNVCSQVFDHTSVVQFLEHFISNKTGKPITETNITNWRRAVCGNLVSSFKPYNGEMVKLPVRHDRNEFVEGIHRAQFKGNPQGYRKLSLTEIAAGDSNLRPRQEKGTRTSCALPYELYADGGRSPDRKRIAIRLSAATRAFGSIASGAPFLIYAPGLYRTEGGTRVACENWSYAVTPGDTLSDEWAIDDFADGRYFLRVYGPNGFFREFAGSQDDPDVTVSCAYEWKGSLPTGNILVNIASKHTSDLSFTISDNAYGQKPVIRKVRAGKSETIVVNLAASHHWYDITVRTNLSPSLAYRFAGKVEHGKASMTDPAMA